MGTSQCPENKQHHGETCPALHACLLASVSMPPSSAGVKGGWQEGIPEVERGVMGKGQQNGADHAQEGEGSGK